MQEKSGTDVGKQLSLSEPALPFVDEDYFKDCKQIRPAEPLLNTNSLVKVMVPLPGDLLFTDRILPLTQHAPSPNTKFAVE